MKKHAFLITCHKQPGLLRRIINVLQSDNHYFFIHIDLKADTNLFYHELKGIVNIHFVEPRISVWHNHFTQVTSHLNMLNFLKSYEMKNGIKFDFIHHISGQDYPLRSNELFDSFFESSECSYMFINDETYYARYGRDTLNRAVYSYHINPNKIYGRIVNKIFILISKFFPRKKINNLWGATDWYSWNRRTFEYVTKYVEDNPQIVKRWRYTACPLESFLGTILHGREKELNINGQEPLRFVSWIPRREIKSKYRPYNLTDLDYDIVVNSRAFFCRKVDENESAKLLEMIDEQRSRPYELNDYNYYV